MLSNNAIYTKKKTFFLSSFSVDHRVVLSFEALEFVPSSSQKHHPQNNSSYSQRPRRIENLLQIEDCVRESNYIEFLIQQQQPQQSLKLCLDTNLGLEKRQTRSTTSSTSTSAAFTDHSELKFQKKSIFKSTKSTFLTFLIVQKHIFCYFKNGKKSFFGRKKSLKL